MWLLIGAVLWLAICPAHGWAAGPEPPREDAPGAPESKDDSRDRWFLALGAGLLSADGPAGTFTFDHALFGSEKGEFDADYAGGDASLFELSVGVRLRDRLGLGITWSQSSLSDSADIRGRLPHPFLFGNPRDVEGKGGGLDRDETAVHFSLRWLIREGSKVQVALFGGPSRIGLDYDLVSAVSFGQSYPFDTATYTGVQRRVESGSATGYHVGVDVVHYFSRRGGLGAVVRYSDASIELDAPGGGTVSVGGGRLQASVDLRMRFSKRVRARR